MMPVTYGTSYGTAYGGFYAAPRNTGNNSTNLQPDSSLFMQYERVSQRNVEAAIQGLAKELEQHSSDTFKPIKQEPLRQPHQATVEAQRRKTIEDCFTVAKLNPFRD